MWNPEVFYFRLFTHKSYLIDVTAFHLWLARNDRNYLFWTLADPRNGRGGWLGVLGCGVRGMNPSGPISFHFIL